MPFSLQTRSKICAHPGRRWPVAVLGQVSESHAVVGQHRVDRVGEDGDHLAQEGRPIHLAGRVVEVDVGELATPGRWPGTCGACLPPGAARRCRCGRSRYGSRRSACAWRSSLRLWAIERCRAEPGSGEGRCGSAWGCSRAGSPEHHQAAAGCGAGTRPTMASSALVSTVLRGRLGPIGCIGGGGALTPLGDGLRGSARSGRQGRGSPLATLGARLEFAALCGRCREELPAIARPPPLGTTHHDSPGPNT